MTGESFKQARRLAYRIVLGQLSTTLLAAAIAAVAGGGQAAVSALAGGGIGTTASVYMAYAFFRHGENADPQVVLRGVYRGEAVKLALTVLLMVLTLVFLRVSFAPFFGAYAATLLVYWVALARVIPAIG